MLQETIGKVVLHYDYYAGDDLYSDGAVEDKLLEIVKTVPESDFDKAIVDNPEWPVFYHLSGLRQNILNWYDFGKDKTVLEIGSGCGALTGFLSDSCRSVDCVELSKKRSLINAYRNRSRDNISIYVGDFEDFSASTEAKYDYIILIGVLEYCGSFSQSATPQIDYLKTIRRLLKEDGKLFLGIENKLGMKYWAGCREDHLGSFFSGIENYPADSGVKTFSRSELCTLFQESGFTEYEFYYPYPDYKFPHQIFSDARLPEVGELIDNRRNFDSERVLLFDEAKAFDNIVSNKLFPVFSNSYLVVLEQGK